MSGYEAPRIIKPAFAAAAVKQSPIQGLLEFLDTRSFRRVLGIVSVGSAAIVAYFLYQRSLASRLQTVKLLMEQQKAEEEARLAEQVTEEETKVILYQVPRGFFTPAVAPFGLKLETFLRVAKIPYEVHLSTSKHEVDTPWIKIGDQDIRDGHECFRCLCKEFNVNLGESAPNSRKTASYLVDAVLDSKIYWAVALWRWVYDDGKSLKDIQPLSPTGEDVLENIKESVLKSARYNNIGRLSQEEVISNAIQDLNHLSAALGKHPYFLGEEAGEVDCNAFSILAQMVWNMPGSPFEQAIKKQKSLMDFVIRVREKFWPDWDDLIQQPLESKVTSQVSLIDPAFNESGNSKSSGIAAKSLSLAAPIDTKPSSTLETDDTNANPKNVSKPSKPIGSTSSNNESQPSNEEMQPFSPRLSDPDVDNQSLSANLPSTEINDSKIPKEVSPPFEITPTNRPTTPYVSTPNLGSIIADSKIPKHSLTAQNLQPKLKVRDSNEPMSIREIVNSKNSSKMPHQVQLLAQEQANQIQNIHMQHHQATLEREGHNKFQQVRNDRSAAESHLFLQNGRVPATYQPPKPSSISSDQYYPKTINQPEFMKDLANSPQATMFQVRPSRTPVSQDQQNYQMSEQDRHFYNTQGYAQRNNAQVREPESNHDYERFWQ